MPSRSQRADAGPAPRAYSALAYDNDRRRLVYVRRAKGTASRTQRHLGMGRRRLAEDADANEVAANSGMGRDRLRQPAARMVMFGGFLNGRHSPRRHLDCATAPTGTPPVPAARANGRTRKWPSTASAASPCISAARPARPAKPGRGTARPGRRRAARSRRRARDAGARLRQRAPPRRPRTAATGAAAATTRTDTWEWDGADWQQVAIGTAPGRAATARAWPTTARAAAWCCSAASAGAQAAPGPGRARPIAATAPIAGDINCDGVVDIDDGKIVDAARGGRPAPPTTRATSTATAGSRPDRKAARRVVHVRRLRAQRDGRR